MGNVLITNYSYLTCKAFSDILIHITNLCPAQDPGISCVFGKTWAAISVPLRVFWGQEVTLSRELLREGDSSKCELRWIKGWHCLPTLTHTLGFLLLDLWFTSMLTSLNRDLQFFTPRLRYILDQDQWPGWISNNHHWAGAQWFCKFSPLDTGC